MSTHRTPVMLMILLLLSAASANDLVGQASVVDGDTLEIHGTRIRLWGIDAPESGQLCRDADSDLYQCGAKAANDLDTFIARRPVDCTPVAEDQYGWTVATCSVGGADLGEWLQPVPSPVPISENGLCTMVSRWIGRNIRKASTAPPSARPIVRVAGCGRAAMWSRGCVAAASGRVVLRLGARPDRFCDGHLLQGSRLTRRLRG